MKKIMEHKLSKFKRSALALIAMSVLALAIASGASSNPTTNQSVSSSPNMNGTEVKIDNFVFNPETVTIKPGDTITWTNDDDIPHTVVASKQAFFRSKPMDTEDKYSFTFKDAGSFEYFCGLHPHMKGKVVVAP